uniref:Uncharacterized protein n=1 Tax=Rhodopseudomonas palustris (strain BisA53) TaxID=316055 RepID=Q07NV7_RHOP5
MLRLGRPIAPRFKWSVLSPEDDAKIRAAFGRFGGTQAARNEVRDVISKIHNMRTRHWIFCDCNLSDSTPAMYTRNEDHVVRHHKSPPHSEYCDFYVQPIEQIRINQSYVCHPPDVAYDFLQDRRPSAENRLPHNEKVTASQRRQPLARLLFSVLDESGIHTVNCSFPPPTLTEQFERIRLAAAKIQLTSSGIRLGRVLATNSSSTSRMISDIERPALRWPEHVVRHGILIDRVAAVETDHIMFLGGGRLRLTGRCSIFGETLDSSGSGMSSTRPPYLAACVIIVVGGIVRVARCYLHPMRSNARLCLVDSNYERSTWTQIDRIIDASGHNELFISKPLHDIWPQFAHDDTFNVEDDLSVKTAARPVLIPDFIIRYPRMRRVAVVETMGYADPAYRQRKRRTHALMIEALKAQEPNNDVRIIEHDFDSNAVRQQENDEAFSLRLQRFLFSPE